MTLLLVYELGNVTCLFSECLISNDFDIKDSTILVKL